MNFRQIVLGKPLATHLLEDETLPKIVALPIFSSDALSSVAYATQEIMLALVVAGYAAFRVGIWDAVAIVVLLVILTISYRQTISAYPQGGGAYNVAFDNLGVRYAQVAAVSLMTDYILTVAVSVASGIDAIISTDEALLNHLPIRLVLCLFGVWFIVWMNLRGVRESGRTFAIPVYIFLFAILTLIGIGLFQLSTGGFHHVTYKEPPHWDHLATLTGFAGVYLILKSFSQGCTALTGLEAISNSTGAFQVPKAQNAQTTMVWLAAFLGTMLLGITWLAQKLAHTINPVGWVGLVPTPTGETVISQIAHATVGNTWFYWVVQISTFTVLILAANTSFTGFPRLSAMVAADGFLPKQLTTLGDRLVFSNGIIALGFLASLLILAFKGSTDRLIPLYAVGVYLAFTLSQSGMVQRWRKLKTPGWQGRAVMNGIGACITAMVALIFGVVKFMDGAFVVLILIPLLTFLLHRIGTHYTHVYSLLKPAALRIPADSRRHVALVPAPFMSDAVKAAVEYARLITPDVEIVQRIDPKTPEDPINIEGATTITDRVSKRWTGAILSRVRTLRDTEDTLVTIVLSEPLPFQGWARLLRGRTDLVVKLALLNTRGVVVADTQGYRQAPGLNGEANANGRLKVPHMALVLVPRVHRGVLEAVSYARRISREVQALNIEIDPHDTPALREQWDELAPDIPLLVMESPYRQLRAPLVRYIQALRLHKPGVIITVVVPEFVALKWYNKLLHNQNGLILKLALRGVPGIVLANPRYFLDPVETPVARRETLVR